MVEPRVKRHRSEEDEEEAAPAPEMLSVEGEAAGMRWPRELQRNKTFILLTHYTLYTLTRTEYVLQIQCFCL